MDNQFLDFKKQCLENFLPETLKETSDEIRNKIKNANVDEYKNLSDMEFQAYMITLVTNPILFNSLMASLNLLENYHKWLIENYDLSPKKY